MARADRDIDDRRGARKGRDKRAGETVANAPACEGERAAPERNGDETRRNPNQCSCDEPEKSDETPSNRSLEFQAPTVCAGATIHMIRVAVTMSQAADILSPTADKNAVENRQLQAFRVTGRVRSRVRHDK